MAVENIGVDRGVLISEDTADRAILSWVSFIRSIAGIVVSPYQTMRKITERESLWEIGYILLCVGVYFGLISLVRVTAFHPFLLTRHFLKLFVVMGVVYSGISGLLYVVSRVVGGRGNFLSMAVGWGYTLVPTLVWFFMTSMLSVLLPPPRTTSLGGTSFSLLFLGVSAILLYWKIMLAYLAVRFAMRLDLVRICAVFGIVVPCALGIGVLINRMGIFRVPFI